MKMVGISLSSPTSCFINVRFQQPTNHFHPLIFLQVCNHFSSHPSSFSSSLLTFLFYHSLSIKYLAFLTLSSSPFLLYPPLSFNFHLFLPLSFISILFIAYLGFFSPCLFSPVYSTSSLYPYLFVPVLSVILLVLSLTHQLHVLQMAVYI